MKKISTLFAAALVAVSFNASAEDVWVMPGTYQGWKLENNIFENVDGKLQQTIPDLYGDFKIVRWDSEKGASWDNQWGTADGVEITPNVPFEAKFNGDDINIKVDQENLHFKNVLVTITPGADNALTILLEPESSFVPGDKWQLVGAEPLEWGFGEKAPSFVDGGNGVWTLAYEGTISGDFKVVKNATWANSYSIQNDGIMLNTEYTLDGPGDLTYNMKPGDGPWNNPTFTLTVGETVKLSVSTQTSIDAINADNNAEAVYYNLQGQRVVNPAQGALYIRVSGDKAEKVIL